MIDKIFVASVRIDLFTVASLHETIKSTIQHNDKKIFFHANARLVELANTTDRWLIEIFDTERNYVMCDGSGIQLAAKLTRQSVPKKIPYNLWIWELTSFLAKNNFSIFFLGADDSTLSKTIERLRTHSPTLNIVGYHNGYFDKNSGSAQNRHVLSEIDRHKPHALLVGFGMPLQERWIIENLDMISCNAIFTCGGAFDFISGKKMVAPYLFRATYLEWLFRFIQEPIRLFSRATRSNFNFIKILLKKKK